MQLLTARILFEERFLRRELKGYAACMGRVPWRLTRCSGKLD
jgi:protein-S-isoprenylcysteine O-methyltransferase Ste14